MIRIQSFGLEKYTRISSANKVSFCSPAAIFIPLIVLFCLIHCSSGSMKIMNRSGLNGKPCLVDLCNRKEWVSLPLIFHLADGLLYRASDVLMITWINQKFSTTFSRNFHLTESKAFSASKLISIACILLWFIYLIICKDLLMLSWV